MQTIIENPNFNIRLIEIEKEELRELDSQQEKIDCQKDFDNEQEEMKSNNEIDY